MAVHVLNEGFVLRQDTLYQYRLKSTKKYLFRFSMLFNSLFRM